LKLIDKKECIADAMVLSFINVHFYLQKTSLSSCTKSPKRKKSDAKTHAAKPTQTEKPVDLILMLLMPASWTCC